MKKIYEFAGLSKNQKNELKKTISNVNGRICFFLIFLLFYLHQNPFFQVKMELFLY